MTLRKRRGIRFANLRDDGRSTTLIIIQSIVVGQQLNGYQRTRGYSNSVLTHILGSVAMPTINVLLFLWLKHDHAPFRRFYLDRWYG